MAFTPEVKSALRWFDETHELVVTMSGARFERTSLAGPGYIGDQDYRLLTALNLLRRVHNDLVTPKTRRQDG